MIPTQGKGVDAVNFRSLRESESVDIGVKKGGITIPLNAAAAAENGIDPFGDFNSITLYHIGEHDDEGSNSEDDSPVEMKEKSAPMAGGLETNEK